MKATARNQFAGTISAVEAGPVTEHATVSMAGGQKPTAFIQARSVLLAAVTAT